MVLGAVAYSAMAVGFPLANTDIWWHLATGRWMASTGEPPRFDPFGIAPGTHWIDLHWGFQWTVWRLWEWFQAPGLVWTRVIVFGAGLGLLSRPMLRAQWRTRIPWYAVAMVFGSWTLRHGVLLRPTLFTMGLLAVVWAVLEAHARGGSPRVLAWMLPIQVAMVNIQGLFPLGFTLVFAAAAGSAMDSRRAGEPRDRTPFHLALAGCGMAAVCLLNPYGLGAYGLPLRLLGRILPLASNPFALDFAENHPTLWLWGTPLPEAGGFLWLSLLTAGSFAVAQPRRRWRRLLPWLLFWALGASAIRNLPLFFFASLATLAANLGGDATAPGRGTRPPTQRQSRPPPSASEAPRVPGKESRSHGRDPKSARSPRTCGRSWIFSAGLWALLAALLAYRTWAVRREAAAQLTGSALAPFQYPEGALAYLLSHAPGGPLFHSIRDGGYLLFWGGEDWRPFVDGRMVLRSAEFFTAYLEAVDEPGAFENYREAHGFAAAMLPITSTSRYGPLAGRLLRSPRWRAGYCDGSRIVFFRRPRGISEKPGGAGEKPAALNPSTDSVDAIPPIWAENARNRFGKNPVLYHIAMENMRSLIAGSRL